MASCGKLWRAGWSDVGNYRSLTTMSSVENLVSSLLVLRLFQTATLHNQQYAFRPGRGTQNTCRSLIDTIQARTEQRLLTYYAVHLRCQESVQCCSLRATLVPTAPEGGDRPRQGIPGACWYVCAFALVCPCGSSISLLVPFSVHSGVFGS